MELYDLRPKTAELVELLRTRGTISYHNRERANGKSTALLIFAKELVDKAPYGSRRSVLLLSNTQLLRMQAERYRGLFANAGPQPGFITRLESAYGHNGELFLLVDEPHMLFDSFDKSYKLSEFSRRPNVKVYTVGRWV